MFLLESGNWVVLECASMLVWKYNGDESIIFATTRASSTRIFCVSGDWTELPSFNFSASGCSTSDIASILVSVNSRRALPKVLAKTGFKWISIGTNLVKFSSMTTLSWNIGEQGINHSSVNIASQLSLSLGFTFNSLPMNALHDDDRLGLSNMIFPSSTSCSNSRRPPPRRGSKGYRPCVI